MCLTKFKTKGETPAFVATVGIVQTETELVWEKDIGKTLYFSLADFTVTLAVIEVPKAFNDK